jgi:hypothetical protein
MEVRRKSCEADLKSMIRARFFLIQPIIQEYLLDHYEVSDVSLFWLGRVLFGVVWPSDPTPQISTALYAWT